MSATLDEQALYRLLPTLLRTRDQEVGGPLAALVAVVAREVAAVQEGIDQAYDDLFIETCAPWVVPYLGALLGATPSRPVPGLGAGARAEVANTLALRRRKGTIAVVEEIARDATDWPAVALECFTRLATTQHVRHVRAVPPATLDLRDRRALELVDGPFDRAAHLAEVRRVASGRGRWNIPNVALFLHRLRALPLVEVVPGRVDDRRHTFDPLGIDQPLFTRPEPERSIADLAQPVHVPVPITRLAMRESLDAYYGPGRSVLVTIDGVPVDAANVRVCDLGDAPGGAWAHAPVDHVAIDPVRGRLALPTGEPAPARGAVRVHWHVGAADAIGGGGYDRAIAPLVGPAEVRDGAGLAAALAAIGGTPHVRITDSRSYAVAAAAPNVRLPGATRARLVADDGARPLVVVSGGDFVIEGDDGSALEVDGLVLAGATVRVTGAVHLVLRHCTLVPGLARTRENAPAFPDAPSLVIESPGARVTIDACITGTIRAARGATVTVTHSIVDAGAPTRVAFAGAGGAVSWGGALALEATTVVGTIDAARLDASSCILLAGTPAGAPPDFTPVRAAQRQAGCVRFSWLPPGSRTASPYRCLPDATRPDVAPVFTATRFGVPGQLQLAPHCPDAIRDGGEDDGEMGVHHGRFTGVRLANLRRRLDEYLRFGLEAGIVLAS